MSQLKAILALEDGQVFSGVGFGAPSCRTGEVVFNTAMTGYQEILTDPSYAGQLVMLTAAHVGNTGVNRQDQESDRVHCHGLIVRDHPRVTSSWRAESTLDQFLLEQNRSGISGIDTRALTHHLREKGAMNGCLMVGEQLSPSEAVDLARACQPMQGQDLASSVSTKIAYEWTEGPVELFGTAGFIRQPLKHHVVCVDFGVKRNILRLLVGSGCRVTVVPAQSQIEAILALKPDGILLSNGPGDPEPCRYAIQLVADLLEADIPTLGICLGHQLLALGAQASTTKMKFGHHGANHPVKDLETGQVFITSQNHGFAVDESGLPPQVVATHVSLFDGSIQGIRIQGKRAMGFQGHPEASPGPHDLYGIFGQFMRWMENEHA